ncbi:MAG TPA: cupin domain-containing protein [Planctomycetota bacterium]|nr:cupin domain-containing protein [Planctomycetota bacterium]
MPIKSSEVAPPSLDDALADEIRAQRVDSMSGPDSPEGRELARAVGANISRHRTMRSLDLVALSVKSGIPLDLLSALEAGQAVPSLRALWNLATALEVPFGSMLKDTMFSASTDLDFRVQRADRGRVIRSATDQFRSRVLFREGDPRSPEVYELTLAAGCFEEATPHARDTFEHIVVVEGTLIVRAGDKETKLQAGDSIFFRADLAHSYRNPTREETIAHLVMAYAATA